jgi:hypothetical protein
MVMVMTVAGNEEGDGDSGKSDGYNVEGGRQATAMRVIATRVAGEQRQRGQWQR